MQGTILDVENTVVNNYNSYNIIFQKLEMNFKKQIEIKDNILQNTMEFYF